MPINKVDSVDKVKTAKEVKQEQKEELEIKKELYGAGKNGWTKEWFERIKEAQRNNTLSIGNVRPDKEGKYHFENGSEEQKWVSSVAFILDDVNKQNEEDLTDAERLILMMLCHPIEKVKVKAKDLEEGIKSLMVVESPKWHELTNWRHLDELMKYRPELYAEWRMRGIIPPNIKVEENKPVEADEDTKAFIDNLRENVPEDSPLRQPHEDWFIGMKEARWVDENGNEVVKKYRSA